MATEVRNTFMDKVINPSIMPGTKVYFGKVTNLDNTKTLTMKIDAKSVLIAVGFVGTGVITPSITPNAANTEQTIVFTSGADNSTLQYIIVASETEEISHPAATDATNIELTCKQ